MQGLLALDDAQFDYFLALVDGDRQLLQQRQQQQHQLIEAGKLAAVLSRAGVVLLGQVTQVVSQQQLSRVKLAYQVGT